jgi:hypothetical protein
VEEILGEHDGLHSPCAFHLASSFATYVCALSSSSGRRSSAFTRLIVLEERGHTVLALTPAYVAP